MNIALLDIKKNGEPWGASTDYAHGIIGAEWLEQFPLDDPESSMAMAIKLVAAREAAEEKAGDVFAGFEEME